MNVELPRVIHTDFADMVGVSRARMRTEVRRGNWRAIARGAVLTRPDVPTRADWAELGVALGGPTAALSGWDALRARGAGGRLPPSDQVLVLSRHSSNRVVGCVRIRETNRPYSVTTASAAATYSLLPIVDCARGVADASLEYRGAAAVRALVTGAVQQQLCTIPDLVAELESCPRQHSGHFRAALSDALDGARSAAEAVAARRMSGARLPAFELNVPLVRHGVVVYVADVLWRALRAVLEVDSREYHFNETAWKRTMRRHNALTRAGLAVTHYPPSVVTGRDREWLVDVAEWLSARAAELATPLPARTGAARPGPDGPLPLVLA
jgi:hypothetical protein